MDAHKVAPDVVDVPPSNVIKVRSFETFDMFSVRLSLLSISLFYGKLARKQGDPTLKAGYPASGANFLLRFVKIDKL